MTSAPTIEDAAAPAPGQRPLRRIWVQTFVTCVALSLCWTLASPPGSGPDEPAHTIRAVSVAKGQIVGARDDEIGGGATTVAAPLVLNKLGAIAYCFAFEPDTPAGCGPSFAGSRRDAQISTRAGLAPPLYYVLTGAPLRAFPSSRGLYLARLLGASIAAAMLATAVTLATRARSPLLLAGIVVAWTPMSAFLTGVLNPSGLELAAALLLWVTGAIALSPSRGARRDPLLAIGLGLSGSAYAMARQLSPLWVVLTLICLAPLVTRTGLRELLQERAMRVAVGLSVLVGAMATAWLLLVRPLASPSAPSGPDQTQLDAISTSVGRLGTMYRQAIGTFGWVDTPSPSSVIWTWTALLGTLVLVGLVFGTRRWRISLAICAITTIAIPPLIEASQADVAGPVWQGRYTLPLAMGLPILASRAADLRARSAAGTGRIATTVALLAVAAQGVAYYVALRRYAVGVSGPVWFASSSTWQPPVPMWVLLALPLGVLTAAGLGLVHLIATSAAGRDADHLVIDAVVRR